MFRKYIRIGNTLLALTSVIIFGVLIGYTTKQHRVQLLRRKGSGSILMKETVGTTTTTTTIETVVQSTNDRIVHETTEKGLPMVKKEKLTLDDVFISVRTGRFFHESRIPLIVKTWWNQAKNQTYFFTDANDHLLDNMTGGQWVNTRCGKTHKRVDMSCKWASEYAFSMKRNKKWWCHFDDDNYVNVDLLVDLLSKYDWRKDVYLGKPTIIDESEVKYKNRTIRFRFAHGGTGVCISKSLREKMSPLCSNGQFQKWSLRFINNDDVTVGIIVTNLLKINITKVDSFHSHFERLATIPERTLTKQTVLSYYFGKGDVNVISLKNGTFTATKDPTRLLSLHCQIHPKTDWCIRKIIPSN